MNDGTYANAIITDTIPKGLAFDGMTNGSTASKEIILNNDGTTTLVFELEMELGKAAPAISYQCIIGDMGNIDNDVKDGQELTNTVTIQADGDSRLLTSANGNIAGSTLKIRKGEGTSLIKVADLKLYEISGPVTYKIYFNNNSATPVNGLTLLDILPYNGDGRGADYSGELALESLEIINGFNSSIEVLYSQDVAFHTGSKDATAKTIDDAGLDAYGFTTAGSSGELFAIPDNDREHPVTAVVVTGDIPAYTSLVIAVTMQPGKTAASRNQIGDIYANSVTAWSNNGGFAAPIAPPAVNATVAGRSISGLVWLDDNRNGQRDSAEELVPGVTVTLYDNNGKVERDIAGETLENPVVTDADGQYHFSQLPQGNYNIYFTAPTGGDMDEFKLTQFQKAGVSTQLNSDAVAADSSEFNWMIEKIVLPELELLSPVDYQAANLDVGLIEPKPVLEGKKNSNPASGSKVVGGDVITYTI